MLLRPSTFLFYYRLIHLTWSSPPQPQIAYFLWGSLNTVGQWGTYLREHVLMPSCMAKKLSCLHTFPCQFYSRPLGYCCWCWWLQWRPWQEKLCMSSLVQSHKKQWVLPGTTPLALLLKMLSQVHRCLAIFAFPLYIWNWQHLSLWQFWLMQSTTCMVLKHTASQMGRHPFLPSSSKTRTPKWLAFCFAFKDNRKNLQGLRQLIAQRKIFKPPVGVPIKHYLISSVPAQLYQRMYLK